MRVFVKVYLVSRSSGSSEARPVAQTSMNQAPQGGPSRSPRREGAGPPTTLGGKGGLVYGSRRDGGSLTGLGDGPPTGGGWGGFKMYIDCLDHTQTTLIPVGTGYTQLSRIWSGSVQVVRILWLFSFSGKYMYIRVNTLYIHVCTCYVHVL